jgi:hypothetical protein
MIQFDSIENAIIDILSPIPEEAVSNQWNSDSIWTSQIKERICDLAKKFGYQVCTHKTAAINADWGEWVFDLSWLDFSDGMILELELALECEWLPNLDAIDSDFQKLIISKANHRVMIFQQANLSSISNIIEHFKEQILNFNKTQINDRYLFAGFHWDENKFTFEAYLPFRD